MTIFLVFLYCTENFKNIQLGTDLFDETGANQLWKLGSIHIPIPLANSAIGGGVSY